MRINKYLATCGIASRRECDRLIGEGKVTVNGKRAEIGLEVNDDDEIFVNGNRVAVKKNEYYILNKPKGYICSVSDDKGRKTVIDLLKNKFQGKRIFPVGRLDYDTEGLLLLTTDGDLCNRISHPRNEITKTYIAKIEKEIDESELNKLRDGILLDGTKTKRCRISVLEFDGNVTRLEVVISEGRNRQVRRMFEAINREVIFLKRVGIGELKLGGLGRGEWRELKPKEIEYLQKV